MSYPDLQFVPQMLSPTAYEMGRYGRTPASHFYGLPNIAIPLTEVRAKGFTLPVTLSYNAGGNKPEQHPGWVGLGWSLSAGGSIVRVINGMSDGSQGIMSGSQDESRTNDVTQDNLQQMLESAAGKDDMLSKLFNYIFKVYD